MDEKNSLEFPPHNFSELLREIKKNVACRDNELTHIFQLLGQDPIEEPAKTLFIHGDSGVGKSLIIKNILEVGKFQYAIVNCTEAYSMKLLYESILNQLTKHELNKDNKYHSYAKCNNFLDFIIHLQNISDKFGFGKFSSKQSLPIVIVLDKCEKLRKLDKNILTSFLKLRELSKLKLCVVLLSTLAWTNFLIEDNAVEPLTYYLEHYTQKQILEILLLEKPEKFSVKFYENFLSLLLSIFYQSCKDIQELKYQAKINFQHYSEPIKEGKLTENDTSELWKRAQPFFKKSLKSVYLKIDNEVENIEKLASATSQIMNLELPYYSKYLLISSYLASYNPASEDRRLFSKNHGKIKKSKKPKSEKAKLYMVGPKPFGLHRLFAILSAILDDNKFSLSANLFIEVASLVKMNLITQISEDILDGPTYKCNVGLQFIDVICKNVQFPIRNYLLDFMNF